MCAMQDKIEGSKSEEYSNNEDHCYASWPLKKDDNEGDGIKVEENNPI